MIQNNSVQRIRATRKETAKRFDAQEHQALALWAADCAEHVLNLFEEQNPADNRPRKAIEAARSWARGELTCGKARAAAFATHSAARGLKHVAACAVARAAGHAAGTTHVPTHAPHAAAYAIKAIIATGIAPASERKWQLHRLDSHSISNEKIESFVNSVVDRVIK